MEIISIKTTTQKNIIDKIVQTLSKGGLVIFPTETTYGAGVDATNQEAVDKLLSYKARREGKPLSIAVPDRDMAEKYVEVNSSAAEIYRNFLPGPFTVVSKSKGKTARGVESEFGTLGVRIPDYSLVLDFLKVFNRPVTATSANSSGKKRPYKIDDILNNLSEKQKKLIDLIVDVGELPHNKPSTIIDTTMSAPMTLRQGDRDVDHAVKIDQAEVDFISNSEQETKDIAKRLILKNWNQVKEQGLIIGLDGDLGVGKTIFAKGVAEFLQIKDTITSPTYSYVNEYDYVRHNFSGRMYHLDVWKINSKEELARLDFFKIIQPGNVIIVEWWDQIDQFVKDDLQTKLVKILISENQAGKRELRIREI
ncbi:MAG: threonylcarbamoyl-AMP synthase [Candidatus Pacebacteria bacterium]|nr:threonylcarbamoyl-AMP synthase [Candidatus Paceibacterota bacterium]